LGLKEEKDSVEERLMRLENLIGEMNERQRLTRLDTVLFLVYPVVILGFTLLANGFVQYPNLSNVKILGWPFSWLLFGSSILFAVGIFWCFLEFLRAYLADDLKWRILVTGWVAYGAIGLGGLFFMQLLAMPFSSLIELTAQESTAMALLILAFALGICALLCFSSFAEGMREWFREMTASWCRKNVPMRFRFLTSLDDFSKSKRLEFRLSKIAWVATCLIYAVIVTLALIAKGLEVIVLYHLGAVILLFSFTSGIILRSRIRSTLKRVKKTS
jgi:hypothetical protein